MPSSFETDVAKLTKFITLPLAPREVRWQVVEQGVRTGSVGPTDFELVAVMDFDDASIQKLKDEMVEQTNPKEAYVAKTLRQALVSRLRSRALRTRCRIPRLF